MDAKKLTEYRGKIYGDYIGNIQTRLDLMETIEKRHEKIHDEPMSPLEWMFIWDIVMKLSRLAVTPNHLDTWRDVVGYSSLVVAHLEKDKGEDDI